MCFLVFFYFLHFYSSFIYFSFLFLFGSVGKLYRITHVHKLCLITFVHKLCFQVFLLFISTFFSLPFNFHTLTYVFYMIVYDSYTSYTRII